MKKEFRIDYIKDNKGCYSTEDVVACSFINKEKEIISIMDILNSEIPLKDKGWFLVRKCDLTIAQKKELSYLLALSVFPIHENKYPDDKIVRICLEAIKAFNSGEISREDLKTAAYAAYEAADSDYTTADAAYAAAYAAAVAAADADYTAAFASNSAAYAAAVASDNKIVLKVLIDFVNNN